MAPFHAQAAGGEVKRAHDLVANRGQITTSKLNCHAATLQNL
jgi:hypothetical protein